MDTRWGLDLDMSAVRLMRRDGDVWVEDRVEKIDSPDIEARLTRLIEPIENGGPVMLFLPREQILYTELVLDASAEPLTQIERAMDGRTPYGLDELSIDWEIGDDDKVQVAAIARDTLDEAAAFAEVRDLGIAGYSTLFSGSDFPRDPFFDGPKLTAKATPAEPPMPFATARVPSRPPGDVTASAMAATAKARFTPTPTTAEQAAKKPETPVIDVDDATPVVQVKAPQVPLDPGLPIAAPNAPPRIRTDIAAASVSGHAASLTPGGSVRLHRKRAPVSTLAVFAAALILTIAVAIMVWNILPMRPGGSIVEAPVDTGALPDAVAEDLSPVEPEPVDVETVNLIGEEVLPVNEVALSPPEVPAAPVPRPATHEAYTVAQRDRLPLMAASLPGALPKADRTPPELKLPKMEAAIQLVSPFLGPDPDIDETADDIYVSAFEVTEPAGDAIALPNRREFTAGTLPVLPETVARSAALLPSSPDEAEDAPAIAAPLPAPRDPVASAVEQALADALIGPGGLIPTDFARALPRTPPGARPSRFFETLERRQYGGRTRSELAGLRPPARPESAQTLAAATVEASELAVANSINPRTRPDNMSALIRAARVQQEAARVTATAALRAPDTSSAIEAALEDDVEPQNRAVRPRSLQIPSSASVARQATIEDAIRLNRINLVGVYGAPSDRRALVRLSSGRYVKVKVGDRVDGGTVAQITDSQLYYRKGNRTLSLAVPQG